MLSEAAFMQSDANVALSAAQKAVSLKPREDQYQEDLARAYILQKNFDAAIAILEKLRAATNPAIAADAAQNLDLLHRFKDLPTEQVSVTPYGLGFQIRGGWSVESNANTAAIRDTASPTESGPPQLRRVAPVHFARGKLVNTDCSSTPSAVLNITLLDGTVRKIRVPDRKKIVLIGADDFSCDWTNKRVLLNYRDRGNGDTELISLEVVQ
jgi:tetratricopeptide (TPR) repeat protein